MLIVWIKENLISIVITFLIIVSLLGNVFAWIDALRFKKMEEMRKFYNTNEDFRIYVDKLMSTYQWTLERALQSPITKEYYKYLLSS